MKTGLKATNLSNWTFCDRFSENITCFHLRASLLFVSENETHSNKINLPDKWNEETKIIQSLLIRKRRKVREKTENENIRNCENIITDTIVSVENINKREMIDMIIHEVKDEVSAESLKSQPFLFKGKIRLDGKLVQYKTINNNEHYFPRIELGYL